MGKNDNYGYDSNGEKIDESTVEELYRIAESEILQESKLAELGDVSIDEDTFDYFMTGTAFGAALKYQIVVYTDSAHFDIMDYVKRGAEGYPDFNSDPYFAEMTFSIDVNNDEVSAEFVEAWVYDENTHSDYFTDNFTKWFDTKQMCKMIEKIANPIVRDIHITLSNL